MTTVVTIRHHEGCAIELERPCNCDPVRVVDRYGKPPQRKPPMCPECAVGIVVDGGVFFVCSRRDDVTSPCDWEWKA